MVKDYKLSSNKAKVVRDNNLTAAESKYVTSKDNIYYDFSLLDEIQFDEDYEREVIEKNLMEYHAQSWYEQPMPTIIIYDNHTHFVGQIRTTYRRVFRASGKRMMVIVEVTKLHIEKQKRKSIYDKYLETVRTYDADNHHAQCDSDLEVA